MNIQTAIGMATTAFDEAKQALAIAERTKILVDAFIKTGSARVMFDGGQMVEMQPILTGNKQQDQWNIYYECRNWAEHSLRMSERAQGACRE